MFVLYFHLFFINLQVVSASEAISARRGKVRDVTFSNFIQLEGHRLLAQTALKTLQLGSSLDCLLECNADIRCLSTNVNTTSNVQGLLECVLLESDKYQDENNFTKVDGFDHYTLSSKCENNPCKHNGKCIPLYANNSYRCECLPGTKGDLCQIKDFRDCAQQYAAGYKYSGVYKIKAPDNTTLDVSCSHDNGSGWMMVFKSVTGQPLSQGPSGLWKSNTILESSLSESRKHYKNRIVDQWEAFKPNKVRLSLYTNKAEVLRLIFNGTGSTKVNWFSLGRLISSPWTDIVSEPKNFFSISGDTQSYERTFFINRNYGGCDKDHGWMLLVQKKAPCSYESAVAQFSIFYSAGPTSLTYKNMDTSKNVADTMTIYVQ